MTLRQKSYIAIAVTLIVSVAVIFGVSQIILVRQVKTVERTQMLDDISAAGKAIERELTELDARAFDYAVWDETYDYMENPSQDYVDTNLLDNVYTSFDLNLCALVRPEGKVLYGMMFDLETGVAEELPSTLKNLWIPESPLMEVVRTAEETSGIVRTEEGTLLVASCPILRSDEQGPPVGALVMGRLLTEALTESLSEQTQMQIRYELLDASGISPGLGKVLPSLAKPGSFAVAPINSQSIVGYMRFDDIYGRPALALEVESPRVTYQEGISAVTRYIAIVAAIILIIGAAVNVALGGWVLAPLRRMLGQVKALASQEPHTGRLETEKGVEFGDLGRGINELLGQLETAQNRLSRLYSQVREQAESDSLTGLLSRRAIFKELETALNLVVDHHGRLAIMMIDVDGFKVFNDTHGHLAGDQMLAAVGQVLSSSTRAGDLIGRYGGDEFLVILPNTDARGAVAQARRLLQKVDKLAWTPPKGAEIPLSLSIGVSAFPEHGSSLNELVAFADANLYESKRSGGHAVRSTAGSDEEGKTGYGFGLLDGLITAVSEKDHYTRKHSEQVASLAVRIAEALELPGEAIRAVRIAGLLHDVGKTGIPASLLCRPGPLTAQDQATVRRHVEIGMALIRDVPELDDVLAAVGSHHERVDGTGYPHGLEGEEIPLLGRILAVADAYSAMTTHRPYRRGRSHRDALEEMRSIAGTQLDSWLVDVFITCCDESVDPSDLLEHPLDQDAPLEDWNLGDQELIPRTEAG